MSRRPLSQNWHRLEVLIQEHHVWVLCLRRLKFLGVWLGSPGMTDPLFSRVVAKKVLWGVPLVPFWFCE